MAELRPYPFGALVRRMLREARLEAKVFDLPLAACFFGEPGGPDLSVSFHGMRAGTPLGPAAGPQSQMAQNLVLSWLAGCRIMELKTVQVLDQLDIPRPCIDMATVGLNVEWSQELRLRESLEEYVKGSMLIEVLRASGEVPDTVATGASLGDVIFDMSVGYDLAGIQSESVQEFIRGMQDASQIVERLRGELLGPDMADVLADYPQLASVEFSTELSSTLTLSTFHGCPPDEIERICSFLMESCDLDVIVKLNPTLLGHERVHDLLSQEMGYTDQIAPKRAFEADMQWDEMVGIVDRLGHLAEGLNRGFGVKFTNTLVVENSRDFFPATEKEMYLSGAPLHVLAMNLVARFRDVFGARFPISFSAGIDRGNFPDAVALGLIPVTVCTDLLRPGGYARGTKYFSSLDERMRKVGARNIDEFVILGLGHGREALGRARTIMGPGSPNETGLCEQALEEGAALRPAAGDALFNTWVQEAALLNTAAYVGQLALDPRYSAAKNSRPPKKIGVHLTLFDCTTCDKCVPVCPNNANFTFVLPRLEVPILRLQQAAGEWSCTDGGLLVIEKQKQYANFADFCNDCGNCDVFCPEDGGPYVIKPRFFGSQADFETFADQNGFVLLPGGGVLARISGQTFSLAGSGPQVEFSGPGFELSLDPASPLETVSGTCNVGSEADLTYLHILDWVRSAVFESATANYLNMGVAHGSS